LLVAFAQLFFALSAGAAQTGDVVYEADFNSPDALKAWQHAGGRAELATGWRGTLSVVVDRPAERGEGHQTLRIALPLEKIRGTRLRVECMAKADGVAKPPQPWNGVKCMVNTVAPSGRQWLQQSNVHGTFDWKPLRFTAEVPADATEAWLVLGLEATSGKVWFDDITIKVVGHRRQPPAQRPEGPVFKGHNLPRLRGAMIGHSVDAADLEVFAGQWKANHVRWQLTWGGFPRSPADKADTRAYDEWLERELQRLDRLLPLCEKLGIRVLIDLHTPPGGRDDANNCRMFADRAMQEHFVAVWDRMARRYKGKKAVWGYDLVNEPVEGSLGEGLMDWRALATKTAKLVRSIDAESAIVIEPAPWGSPAALDWFSPIDVPGVVYSVHMYMPHRFTHQGVHGDSTDISYPGTVDGQHWDKEQLRKALQPVVDFQRDHNVHIYIGEFSAIRWAPDDSAVRYLSDCIDIFEENGWDWAYHAFREWDGWSVEHGSDRADRRRAATATDRQQLLQRWFEKNRGSGKNRH
jgi:hypothetical protein